MSEKNYQKLYLEAIKRAKDYRDGKNPEALKTAQAAVEFIFPEMKEDDETIRKRLVYFISNWKEMCHNNLGNKPLWTSDERECDIMLDWLEKHQYAGTKNEKTPERIKPKFAVGDVISRNGWNDHIVQEIYICDDPVYVCTSDGQESHVSFSSQDYWHKKNVAYQPKFSVGDVIESKKNTALTYKIINIIPCNELGNPEYEVEIFDNGNGDGLTHCIEAKKMDEWGKWLISSTI